MSTCLILRISGRVFSILLMISLLVSRESVRDIFRYGSRHHVVVLGADLLDALC